MSQTTKIDLPTALEELKYQVSGDESILRRRVPNVMALLDAFRSGETGEQDPPINVTVEGLIGKIEAKRDAIAGAYDEALTALDAEDARRGNFASALQSYFAELGACYGNEAYKFDASTGQLSQKDGGPKLPVQPTRPRTEADVTAARTKAQKAKDEALAPFEGQLDTLRIAADTSVPVQGPRITTLLQTAVPTDLRF